MKFRTLMPIYLMTCCLVLPVGSWLKLPARGPRSGPRRLVLVLDGVPYRTMKELRAEGFFGRFREPARMVSTFPSLTNPAMVEILGHEDSPGYEDHYFDRSRNRLAGTIQDRLRGGRFIRGTFRETFDYHAPAFKGALGYLAAPAGAIFLAQLDLAGFRNAFQRSGSQVFLAYIGETDSLAHLGGEQPLKSFLKTLDRTLDELATRSGGTLEVEMFSDHGNDYADFRQVDLGGALRRAGFDIVKSLADSRSVVLPRHGLVGASEIHTLPGNERRVAEACATAEGVDFAAFIAGENSIGVISRGGRAEIRVDGDRFSYLDLGGDPLKLADAVEVMRRSGELDAGGFAAEESWWARTRSHVYADPLRRIADGFKSNVRNRADVIVSYRNGYLLGSPLLSALARMRATHGNLLGPESDGFAISTRTALGEAVRGTDLNRLFGFDRRRGSADAFIGAGGHCSVGPELARSLAAAGL